MSVHHLSPYRVDALDTSRDLVFYAIAVERRRYRGAELADVLLACGRGLVYLACDLLVLLRKAVLHAEILQFGLDGIESETVCQRREEVDCLAGDLDLLVLGHGAQRTHVVQTVGDLDKYDAHVVREREQHLAEIFGLKRGVGIKYARHFGQAVDHRCDLVAEYVLYVFYRVVGILHHVVQQRCHDRLDAEADLVDDDFCHCDRMQEVRLARTAPYPLMSLFGKEECPFDKVPVLILLAYLLARFYQIGPFALDEFFILRSIVHIDYF